jgi:hypothetical protein
MLQHLINLVTGRPPNPTADWPLVETAPPVINLTARTIGFLRFGDPLLDAARGLGRPDRYTRHSAADGAYITLLYARLGMLLQSDSDGRLDYASFLLAPDAHFPSCPGLVFSSPRLSSGTQLTHETTEATLRTLFGPPKNQDRDTDEIILFYSRDGLDWELEFTPGGKLKLFNLYPSEP